MNAVEYNKGRKYDRDTVRRIQRTVGANPDGKWGPQTVKLVQVWQAQQGLDADGKVGSTTLSRFEEVWTHDADPEGDEDLDDGRDDKPRIGHEHDDDDDCEICVSEAPQDGDDYFVHAADLARGSEGPTVFALQNDLFAFGFDIDKPDGKLGPATTAVIEAFQIAAATPTRLVGHRRVEVPVTFTGSKTGVVDAATRAEIRVWKEQRYCWLPADGEYRERRIRVAKLGTLPRSSLLLSEIPSSGSSSKKLHRLAAEALAAMSAEAVAAGLPKLAAASAWRPHRWKSREHYESEMKRRYGSVKEGSKWVAYSSPHETGLAIDFGVGGLEPKRATVTEQRKTKLYAWLRENAYRFGFHPYKLEPWHWEFALSLRAWTTGVPDWQAGFGRDGE